MKTNSEAKEDQRLMTKQLNTVQVAKKKLLEPLSVIPIVVTIKSKGLLQFDPDPNLFTQGYLSA